MIDIRRQNQFWATFDRSLQNILIDNFFYSFDAFINKKFRSNNVKRKKIRFSSKIRVSNYFSLTDFFVWFNIDKRSKNHNFRFIENFNNINIQNSFNTRKISIEKEIYFHFIDFIMIDNLNSIVQIVIIAIINVVFDRFIKQIWTFQQNRNDRRRDRNNIRNFSSYDNVDDEKRSFIRSIEYIDYFDSILKNVENRSVINVDRYIFYRNVYAFETRLKNLIKKSFDNKIRKLIFFCLRNNVLI